MTPRVTREEIRTALSSLPADRASFSTVVSAVLASRRGQSEAAVAARVGRALADARRDGEVDVREHPVANESFVFFTPLGAGRAGVRLTEDSSSWVLADGSDPGVAWRGEDDGEGHEQPWRRVPDASPSAADRVIAMDLDAILGTESSLYLLGLSLPLPIPKELFDPSSCPAHPGRKPTRREYCFYCRPDETEWSRPRAIRLPR